MVIVGRAYSAWGVRTPHMAASSAAVKALLDHAVGEAYGHVQGESLKPYAALHVRLLNSPITRLGSSNVIRLDRYWFLQNSGRSSALNAGQRRGPVSS